MDYLFDRIQELLVYQKEAPMLFNSGLFFTLFTLFLLFYSVIYKYRYARIAYVTLFSLYFYYKSSGVYVANLALAIVFNYFAAILMASTLNHRERRWILTASIVFNASFLIYFKYFNFLIDNINLFGGSDIQNWSIFLPIGISFYTFQTISYLVDVYRGTIKPCRDLGDFAFYLSFFPQLVAGPIVRAKDFLPQIHKEITFRQEEMGEGLFMIMRGLIKKAIIADYVAQYADIVYANPEGYSGFENLMAMYAYTLQIYCDFSGYSDMAIGLALLMGFRLPENFRSPYVALDITEFWRRWHITLSSWLRDYIYIPLGGNRLGENRQFVNLMLTMLFGGLWHGADWKFVFWGGMHGVGLIVHKVVNQTIKEMEWKSDLFKPLSWIITFHFVAFLWVFFRASSYEIAAISINKIIFDFSFTYFLPFLQAKGLLCLVLAFGYGLHFVSLDDKERMSEYYGSLPLLAKAIILIFIIQIILQIQDENVQPFIYFQF